MSITRLIYFSENLLDPAAGSVIGQLNSILSASNRNNKTVDVTGALVFDEQWFLQALEGEREQVWKTLRRIEDDHRHANVVIVEAGSVTTRLFGNWWMGFAKRDANTEQDFAPFVKEGRLDPRGMTAAEILNLMVRLAQSSMSRRLAAVA